MKIIPTSGKPRGEGFFDKVQPLSEVQKQMVLKHGFGDIEVNMSGGYDPTQTDPDSQFFKAVLATYRARARHGIEAPPNAAPPRNS